MNKDIKIESAEDFLARGGKIEHYKEGKVNKRERKPPQEKKDKVDLRVLLEKANPEQTILLRKIAKDQGLELD